MRILIYGAGTIGSLFAGKLALAGNDVTVLARGIRFTGIKENGVVLQRADSLSKEIIKTKVIDVLHEDDIYDYILVVMQKTQVGAVLPILSRNKSKNIVFVVNNALGYEPWAKAVGEERLMLGFPSAGGERKDGIVSYFVGKGLIRCFQTTTFGEYLGGNTEQLNVLINMFKQSGIPSVACSHMDAWQKTHVAVVTCIANALYKYDSNNYSLAKCFKDIWLMIEGIKEGFSVLKKLGYKVTPKKFYYFKLPTFCLAFVFKAVMNTKLAETAMAKHTIVAREEMQLLQREFDSLIMKAAVKTPAIDALRPYLYQEV